MTTRRELTAAISQRYQAAYRNGKKLILEEFVKVTGYHRKHAIRVLTAQGYTQSGRPVGHRIYQEAVKEALIVLWEASDRICGKRLKGKRMVFPSGFSVVCGMKMRPWNVTKV